MSLFDDIPSIVQSKGPAIIDSAHAIGHVVTKTNLLIESHRDFLANLPRGDVEPSKTTLSLIIPPPPLNPRYASPLPQIIGVLPECSSAVSSASLAGAASVATLTSSLALASSTIISLQGAVQSISGALISAQVALTAANTARLSIQTSASLAISSANFTASDQFTSAQIASSSATSAIASASASASAAISSAQASAKASITAAQSSASSSILSAQSALSSIQSSANLAAISLNSVVASANALASGAQATATLAVAEARASVSSLSQAASANIAASRIAAMNTTKFALAITFAILGSSILSILTYYLITRYRQRRRQARQVALKEKIRNVRYNSTESLGPSLSEFPMPVGRDHWSRGKSMDERRTWNREGERDRSTTSTEMPIQGVRGSSRKTWAMEPRGSNTVGRPEAEFVFPMPLALSRAPGGRAKTWAGGKDETQGSRTITANGMDEDGNTVALGSGGRYSEMGSGSGIGSGRPNMIRKNTLTYDPEHPERPPKFTTWLEESFRSVSPFPKMGAVSMGQGQVQDPGARRSEIGGRGKGGGIGTAI